MNSLTAQLQEPGAVLGPAGSQANSGEYYEALAAASAKSARLWRKREYGQALSTLVDAGRVFLAQRQEDPQAYSSLASTFSSRLVDLTSGKAGPYSGGEILESVRGMFSVLVGLPASLVSGSTALREALCTFAEVAVKWSREGSCTLSSTPQGSGSADGKASTMVYTVGDPAVLSYAAQLLVAGRAGPGTPSAAGMEDMAISAGATAEAAPAHNAPTFSRETLLALHFAAHACHPVPALCEDPHILCKYVLRALAVGNVAVANRAVGIFCSVASRSEQAPAEGGRRSFETIPEFIFCYLLVNIVIKRSLKAAKLLKVRFRDVLTDKEDQKYLQTVIDVYVDGQNLD